MVLEKALPQTELYQSVNVCVSDEKGNRATVSSSMLHRDGCLFALLWLFTLVGFGVYGLTRPRHNDEGQTSGCGGGTSDPFPSELYFLIPLHHQELDYTCGPSSALSVLEAYGFSEHEAALANLMGTNSANGTSWRNIAAVFVSKGFSVFSSQYRTLDDVKAALVQGHVTIIGYEAWSGVNTTTNSSFDWEDSHYSVIIGYNQTGILLMDPWQTVGYYGFIEFQTFLTRWHFVVENRWYNFGLTAWLPERSLTSTTTQPANVLTTMP